MSNLANIYAALRRSYSENYAIIYAAAPTYLQQIIGCPEAASKIVFLFKEDRNIAKFFNCVSPTKLQIKRERERGELDLTGSPLKDDCIVDAIADVSIDFNFVSLNPWSLEEECHKGIALDKARSIVSEVDFQCGAAAREAEGSVWMLCSGIDASKTFLLQYEFVRGFNSRGLVTFDGVVPAFTVNTQILLQRHFAMLPRGHATGIKVETNIENIYHIKSNSISIKCAWNTAAALPALIDLNSCDVTLSQSFRIDDCSPLTEEFMNQLRILMFIRDDIVVYKEDHLKEAGSDMSKDPVYRCGRGIDIEDLRVNVNKVMTEISGFAELDDGSGAECDIEAVVQRAKLRRLTDLTDKLWNILKCCSSYKDLKIAFNVVFQCAAKCNIVNTPTNKNRLAEIITEVANRRLAIPCLSGSEPLELLLEIGIEKLYKDYELIFVESRICSANDLKNKRATDEVKENEAPNNVRKSMSHTARPETMARKTLLRSNVRGATKFSGDDVVSFRNSSFDAADIADQLGRLLQIHCTLEHLLMIQINLNLSSVYSDVCDQLLRKPTRIIAAIDESVVDKIEITLSARDVREHLDGKDPNMRRITLKSNNKFRYVQTTFFFSMENICPPGISECFQLEDKEYAKNNFYYCWLYRKLKTVCPTNERV